MNTTIKCAVSLVVWGCLAQSPAASAADSDESSPRVSLAVKVWNSSWFSFLPSAYSAITPGGSPTRADSIDAVEGERKTTTFPQIAVSKGKVFISGSYAQFTSDFRVPYSSVIGPNGMNVATSRSDHFSRKESDIAAGYSITPNIALTAAIKYATEKRDTTLGLAGATFPSTENTVKGLILGGLASMPIRGNLLAYTQFGYGFGRLTSTFSDNSIPSFQSNGRYLISEVGLNYSLAVSDVFIKGANAGLGYRSQTFKTHGKSPAFLTPRDLRDVRDGLVFTLTVAI